jgi:hypothetical protein
VLEIRKGEAMAVKEIVKKYLEDNGFDGLFSDSWECGCEIDDLMPCEEPQQACEPGYKIPCNCGEGCNWHIGPERGGHHAND